jgi:hypothetical protein
LKKNIAIIITAVIGFSIALYQYLFNRSIWLDEAKLALNILDRDYLELAQPLDSGQIAPILFLWIEKLNIQLFGANELALRLLPLLAFLISILLVIKVTTLLTSNKMITWYATALVCLSPRLIYYATEVKQYSIDVMILLLLYYVFFKPYKTKKAKHITLIIVGIVSLFISNIAVLILFVLGCYTLVFEKKKIKDLVLPGLFWVIAFIAYYALFIYKHPSTELMTTYWGFAFMPSNPFSVVFWSWGWQTFKTIFVYLLGFVTLYYIYVIMLGLYLFSVVVMLKKGAYKLCFLVVFPIVLHLVLSALKLYPFAPRLVLYQVPLYLITIGYGLNSILDYGKQKYNYNVVLISTLSPIVISAGLLWKRLPLKREEVKPVYNHIINTIKPEDKIYVYSKNQDVFDFYNKIGYLNFKNEIILGGSNRKNFKNNNAELDQLTGRVWFIFAHNYKFKDDKITEQDYIINYLKANGAVIKDSINSIKSDGYLIKIKK